MEQLFESLSRAADGAYVIDADQRIVYWNAAAERMLGFRAEDVLGRACHEVLQGRDDDNHAWCRLRCKVAVRSSHGDTVDSFTICARSDRGAARWINVSILPFPITTTDGAHLVVHLFRDSTIQKQQEQLSNQILAMVEGLHGRQPTADQPAAANGMQSEVALSQREMQVLTLLAQGLNTPGIAESLSISVATTRNHIQNIYQKLHVHSRAQAVAFAFEHGLVSRT